MSAASEVKKAEAEKGRIARAAGLVSALTLVSRLLGLAQARRHVEVDVDAISDGRVVLIPGLLEHVERAGVHSGDSVGMFPPQTVSAGDQELIVATMGVAGLLAAIYFVGDALFGAGKVLRATQASRGASPEYLRPPAWR